MSTGIGHIACSGSTIHFRQSQFRFPVGIVGIDRRRRCCVAIIHFIIIVTSSGVGGGEWEGR